MSAVETGSAVVVRDCTGVCRRATRLSWHSGYEGANRCRCKKKNKRFTAETPRAQSFAERGGKNHHKNRIADLEGKRVTIWYVLGDEFTNGFEGRGLLSGLGNGWYVVRGVQCQGKEKVTSNE